jgi:hypothetical protein
VATHFDDLDQLLAALVDTGPIVRSGLPPEHEPNVIVDPDLLREAERMREAAIPPTVFARGTTPPPFAPSTAAEAEVDDTQPIPTAVAAAAAGELLVADEGAEVSDSEILSVRNIGEATDYEIPSLRTLESRHRVEIPIDHIDDAEKD